MRSLVPATAVVLSIALFPPATDLQPLFAQQDGPTVPQLIPQQSQAAQPDQAGAPAPQPAQPGRKMMVVRWGAELKTGNQVVGQANLSEVLVATKSNADWLWIPERRGWILRSAVIPVDEAENYFTSAVNADQTSEAYRHRGLARAALGRHNEAAADFTLAIQLDANNLAAYNDRGNALREVRDYDRAIADFGEVIARGGRSPAVYTNRGVAWLAQGEYQRAIEDFSQALVNDPRFAPAYEARASARAASGNFRDAAQDYREAISLDPGFAQAHNNLAWLLATAPADAVRDGAAAVQHATRACELTGYQDAGFLDTLAAALAEAGSMEEAVDRAEAAARLAPDHKQPAIQQRLQLYRNGQPYRSGANP